MAKGMQKDEKGYYGFIVKTGTLDEALSYARQRVTLPTPDRRSKREANALYRLNLFEGAINDRLIENQVQRASHELTNIEGDLSPETIPTKLMHVRPSPSADDAIFDTMTRQAQRHYETQQERAMRRSVDLQAQQEAGEIRRGHLSDYHFQGGKSAMLGAEVPLELRAAYVVKPGPAYGTMVSTLVPRAPPPALPRSAGYDSVPSLPTNDEVNGNSRLTRYRVGGRPLLQEADSYDSHRRAVNQM
jgi:hypothetical protein